MKHKSILVDCIEWDIVNWSKALTFWGKNVDLSSRKFHCLELGGRSGGLSLWLALNGAHVICSDLENPEQNASKIHRQHNHAGEIQYEAIDASNIPYQSEFDIVIFKSILGGIARDGQDNMKAVVIDQIYKSLKPGGKLLFAENLSGSNLHKFLRKKFIRWGNSWNYLKIDEVKPLFQKFGSLQFETAGFVGAFGASEPQRNFLGHLDTLFLDKIVSDKMKYIIFGIATK
jgi:SAM-dependent methyltransferase